MIKNITPRPFILLLLTVMLAALTVSCTDTAVPYTTVSDSPASDSPTAALTGIITAESDPASQTAPITNEGAAASHTNAQINTDNTALTVPEGQHRFGYIDSVDIRGDRISFLIRTMPDPDTQLTDAERRDPDLLISADQMTIFAQNNQAISADTVTAGDIIAYIPDPDALIQETYPASMTNPILYLEILK